MSLGVAVPVREPAMSRALPRRWAGGGSERGEPRGDGGGEDAAAEARRAQVNAEVKRTLTSLLLEVTDAMFGALLPAVASSSAACSWKVCTNAHDARLSSSCADTTCC